VHPDPEDEYFLVRGDDDGDHRTDDRRTRRTALAGLAVVVVLVALAITATSLFVHTSSAGRGPGTAARRWGAALVHHDPAARRRLECAGGSRTATGPLALAGATGVSTGQAHRLSTNRWSVPLEIDGPGGTVQDSVDVTVVREAGRYVVC
jgi:hypothetical protein